MASVGHGIKLLAQVKQITGTTSDVFLEYIQRNLPEGVTMSVYQVKIIIIIKTRTLVDQYKCFNSGGT